MARQRTSQPCALEGCNNPVAYTYPGFPYCKDHRNLKNAKSSLLEKTDLTFKEVVQTVYRPEHVRIPKRTEAINLVASRALGLDKKTVARITRVWGKVAGRRNMLNPTTAVQHRDALLSAIQKNISPKLSPRRVRCIGGVVNIPGKGSENVSDHEVLVVTDNGSDYVIEPAPASPYSAFKTDNVNKLFRSGQNIAGDRLYVGSLVEYGSFSNVTYQELKDTEGKTVWSNRDEVNRDIMDTRELLKRSPKVVFPSVTANNTMNAPYLGERDASLDDMLLRKEKQGEPPSL